MATITPASANTVQSLNANFKEIYTQIKDLVPAQYKMSKMIPFAKGDKQLGNSINEPVILGLEGGITYGGEDGLAFTLNDIVSFPLKNAQVKSSEMVLRSAISVGMASRSQTQKNAFERGMKLLTGNMLKSMYHRLEVSLLYGRSGIGIVEADETADVLKIEDAEWAAGIWVGTNKHEIDIFSPDLSTKRGTFPVASYDLEARTVTATGASGVALAGDVIYFKGAVVEGGTPEHKDMLGLHQIAFERSSLFSINNSNEPLFQGNVVDVGASGSPAVLNFAKVEEAVAASVEKGLQEEEMCVMVNSNSWNDLLTEQQAKRQYDSSYNSSEQEDGSKAIKFYGQAGSIKIVPHTYIKEGFAYALCEKDLIRIGSTDITFEPPGYEGEFFKLLENANGYEIRAYSDQALFTSKPSCITILRYIKNSRRG